MKVRYFRNPANHFHSLRFLVALLGTCLSAPSPAQVIFDAATDESVPSVLRLWSDGAKSLSLASDATGRVLRIHSEGSAAALVIGRECPIDGTVLEFTYYLRDGAAVWSLAAGLRVKEDGGVLSQMRFPPLTGRWRTERIPVARMMRGDVWRAGPARMAASLEIGIIGDKAGEPFDMDISSIRLLREPGPCSPMTRPMRLQGSGVFSKAFRIDGAPEQAWVMAFARPGFTIFVNGREIGTGSWCNATEWPCRMGSAPAAAEFSLGGILRNGENAVEIAVADGPDAECAVALGWIADGEHRVVVSDGNWQHCGATAQAEPLSDSMRPGLFDIYPVRPPKTWLPSERPDYATLPEYRPSSETLHVRPEEGRWGTTRDESGRWFFSTPSGHRFFFRGIQTVNCFRQNYGYADWARRTYATERDWAADAVALVNRLGYNGVGVAASARSAFDEAARCGMLNLEYIGCADGGPFLVNAQRRRLVGLCDPFDPAFRERLRERLAAIAPDMNARPAVFGICVGNEAHIEGNVADISSSGYVYSAACGAEFVRWLSERHGGDIASLNRAWFGNATNEWLSSFAEVLVRKPDPLNAPEGPAIDAEYAAAMAHLGRSFGLESGTRRDRAAMRADFDAFAVLTVKTYADTVLGLMREFFPDKLIGSNRFLGGATEEMYQCWSDYDFIAVNTYPMTVRGDAMFSERQMEAMRLAHRATDRPVLLTEWGVQALDACLQSPSAQLRTQAERGRGYVKALRQIVENLPFVAGVVDFGFQNLADSEGQGWGIVDNEGQPYADYIDGIVVGARWLDRFLAHPRTSAGIPASEAQPPAL